MESQEIRKATVDRSNTKTNASVSDFSKGTPVVPVPPMWLETQTQSVVNTGTSSASVGGTPRDQPSSQSSVERNIEKLSQPVTSPEKPLSLQTLPKETFLAQSTTATIKADDSKSEESTASTASVITAKPQTSAKSTSAQLGFPQTSWHRRMSNREHVHKHRQRVKSVSSALSIQAQQLRYEISLERQEYERLHRLVQQARYRRDQLLPLHPHQTTFTSSSPFTHDSNRTTPLALINSELSLDPSYSLPPPARRQTQDWENLHHSERRYKSEELQRLHGRQWNEPSLPPMISLQQQRQQLIDQLLWESSHASGGSDTGQMMEAHRLQPPPPRPQQQQQQSFRNNDVYDVDPGNMNRAFDSWPIVASAPVTASRSGTNDMSMDRIHATPEQRPLDRGLQRYLSDVVMAEDTDEDARWQQNCATGSGGGDTLYQRLGEYQRSGEYQRQPRKTKVATTHLAHSSLVSPPNQPLQHRHGGVARDEQQPAAAKFRDESDWYTLGSSVGTGSVNAGSATINVYQDNRSAWPRGQRDGVLRDDRQQHSHDEGGDSSLIEGGAPPPALASRPSGDSGGLHSEGPPAFKSDGGSNSRWSSAAAAASPPESVAVAALESLYQHGRRHSQSSPTQPSILAAPRVQTVTVESHNAGVIAVDSDVTSTPPMAKAAPASILTGAEAVASLLRCRRDQDTSSLATNATTSVTDSPTFTVPTAKGASSSPNKSTEPENR